MLSLSISLLCICISTNHQLLLLKHVSIYKKQAHLPVMFFSSNFLSKNGNFSKKKSSHKLFCVSFRPSGQLAEPALIVRAGGKPSTWFPPGGHVEHDEFGEQILRVAKIQFSLYRKCQKINKKKT